MKEITGRELRERIEGGASPTILDIRHADAFADWHIPGAVNLPIIDAMRANDTQPLHAHANELPKDRELVIVCNAGVSSRKTVAMLHELGFDATSLIGGMRDWSLVHSEAPVQLESTDATLIQVRRNGKGCLSYVLGANDVAAIFDPSVETKVYHDIAQREGWRITHVFETHVHADHISRARQLCAETGAILIISVNDRVTFPYHACRDGDDVEFSDVHIRVISTPGHTGESVCYLINDEALLTGDTLFTDSIGRPDLEKGDAGAEAGARALYESLHDRLRTMQDHVIALPCHTGEPIGFDRAPIQSTLGELRASLEILKADEPDFIQRVVAGIGPKPPSFREIIQINEGKDDLGGRHPLELEAGPNRCAVSG